MRAGVFPAAILIFTTAFAPFIAIQPAAGSPPDGVFITAFHAEPGELVVQYGSEQGRTTLNLTIQNSRQDRCNVTVTVTENSRKMETRTLSIAGNTSLNLSIPWSIEGTGIHRALAALSGGNESDPSSMTAVCEVSLSRALPSSPWYTIPCAFMVIIIPSVAFWLIFRRMKGGDWLERWSRR